MSEPARERQVLRPRDPLVAPGAAVPQAAAVLIRIHDRLATALFVGLNGAGSQNNGS